MSGMKKIILSIAALSISGAAFAGNGAVADEFKWLTFTVFGVIIAITMASCTRLVGWWLTSLCCW